MVTFFPCVSVAQVASKLEIMDRFSAKFRLTPYWLALFSSFVVVVGQYVMLALFINQVSVIVTSDSVVWGYIKYKYHHWGEDDTWYIYLILAGVCYVLFSATVWQLRAKARSEFQIRGNWGEDCWSSFWCPCCALAQTATQVKSYTPATSHQFVMAETDQAYAIQIDDSKGGNLGITVGKWEVDFCSCCTHVVPNCLMVTCCPCISLAQISARLGMMDYSLALVLFILLYVFTGGIGAIAGAIWLWQAPTHIKSYKPGSCDFLAQDTLPAYNRS
ncbi:PLAC8 family protein [Phytophthora palmivora]|uniref:PLAC8 family protein n=1 Tax=Phytophthora palmivora TaxID=4796 RepID=A0A2P4YIE1_9STRA|nr:PLAC8 family protein [Phytophthora palmivora]